MKSTSIKLTIYGSQCEPPEYREESRTRFLNEFCQQHEIEIFAEIAHAGAFSVYTASHASSDLNTLIHYHWTHEESVYLQNDYDLIARKLETER